jgi:hypothetical protein
LPDDASECSDRDLTMLRDDRRNNAFGMNPDEFSVAAFPRCFWKAGLSNFCFTTL